MLRRARIHRVEERFRFQISPESQRVLRELIGRIGVAQLAERMDSESRGRSPRNGQRRGVIFSI
jgi:hypothetical protein